MNRLRPLCRYCGQPIPKRTSYVTFGVAPYEEEKGRGRVDRPATKADAQRLVNGEITSVRWSEVARVDDEGPPPTFGFAQGTQYTRQVDVPRYISQATYWDGESFVDPYFCKGLCAQRYGYFAMKHPGFDTQAYAQACADQAARIS